MAKIIIRDAVDIDTVIDPATTVNDNNQLINDSAEPVVYSTIDLRHQHLRIFSLLSTSDKEINLREYPDKHVEDMARLHKWTTPFAKPLQTNHDIYVDCNARFYDSWYLKHSDLKPKYGYGKLPQGVIDEFVKRGAFNEGTGSTIGMAETANLDFKRKIIDGTYLTTSQGASTNSLTCNICGHEYRDWGKCTHSRGTNYPIMSEDGKTIIEMRRCVPFTGELDAIEDSVVNSPANDTSTLMVYDMKKDRVVTMDNISEYSDIFSITRDENNSENKVTDKTTQTKPVEVRETGKVKGFTDEQVLVIKQMINDGNKITVDELNNLINKANQTTETKNKNTKPSTGGKMAIKNATIKKVFKDSLKALNVVDSDKINDLFDELTKEGELNDSNEKASALDIAMSILEFIADNQKEVVPPTVQTQEPKVEDGKKNDGKIEDDKKDENVISKDSEEYKNLIADFEEAKKMLCDLKGINNEVPTLADIKTELEKRKTSIKSSINDFNF